MRFTKGKRRIDELQIEDRWSGTGLGAAKFTRVNDGELDVAAGNGRMHQPVGTSAPADGTLALGRLVVWVDEGTNTLWFKVKYSSGTVKTGSVALT